MKRLTILFFFVAVLAGCFPSKQTTKSISRIPVKFDFTPPSRQQAGATTMTIALIKPVFITENAEYYVQPFPEMSTSMGNDFEELLTAKGFKIRGPFRSRDEMVYNDKQSCDFAFMVEIDLQPNYNRKYRYDPGLGAIKAASYRMSGEITLGGNLVITASSPQYGEKIWKKSKRGDITGKIGKGDSYKDLERQRNGIRDIKLPQILSNNNPAIEKNFRRISEIDSLVAKIVKPAPDDVKFTGLSTQMDALKRLTSKNTYVAFAYWIFFLLILGIETAPIFVKFFSQKGSYDEILTMNEYEVALQQKKRQSDLHELINSELEGIRSINTTKKIAQDAINEKVMALITEAQSDIAEKAIRLWQLQQLNKVDENVEDFVRSKTA